MGSMSIGGLSDITDYHYVISLFFITFAAYLIFRMCINIDCDTKKFILGLSGPLYAISGIILLTGYYENQWTFVVSAILIFAMLEFFQNSVIGLDKKSTNKSLLKVKQLKSYIISLINYTAAVFFIKIFLAI
uniref:Uncharacterized protein n=1 Tax=Bartonella schoenbuchensis TaxID=165694 RepID=A0A024LRC4_9HYPH|nr:hypothetical protein BN1046_00561 [Bartonella schoenbuchensis]